MEEIFSTQYCREFKTLWTKTLYYHTRLCIASRQILNAIKLDVSREPIKRRRLHKVGQKSRRARRKPRINKKKHEETFSFC